MRGKLRDKRADSKRDSFKREAVNRRRLPRRDNRSLVWLNQQLEKEDDDYLLEEEAEVAVEPVKK